MAELVAVIGTGAAVLQIAQTLLNVSDALEQISDASDDIELFQLETAASSRMLVMFDDVAKTSIPHLDNIQQIKRMDLIDSLTKVFRKVKTKVESVKNFVTAAFEDKSPGMKRFFIRLRWFMKKTLITTTRLMLERAKSSASLSLNMIICEALQRKIAELSNDESTTPEEMRSLRSRL